MTGTAYGLRLEERNDFCASCHTQPEVEYYNRTLKPPSDLSSAHIMQKSVRCIDCHSGAGAFGRADGFTQGVQDLFAYLTNNYDKPAVTTRPLPDANCVKCHDNIFDDKSIRNHYHYYLRDWQTKEPGRAARCVSCHTSHTQGASRTVRYAVDTRLNPLCAACHTFSGIK